MDDRKSIAIPPTRRPAATPQPRRRGRPAPRPEAALGTDPVPAAAPRAPAAAANRHRFRIGQRLLMAGGGNNWSRTRSLCSVVFLMPFESGSPLRYRVRSDEENFDRIVDEADLGLPLP